MYVGLTEIIFLTSLRGPLIDSAVIEFENAFIKPRAWLIYIGSLIFGRQFGRRLILLSVFLILLLLLTQKSHLVMVSAYRFFQVLPILCVVDVLYSVFFICIQVCFAEIKYFRLALTKIIMVFGGVFAPLSDVSSTWKPVLINNPLADIIFQPAYYALTGQFYHVSMLEWLGRIIIQISVLLVLLLMMYGASRKYYQCFGN